MPETDIFDSLLKTRDFLSKEEEESLWKRRDSLRPGDPEREKIHGIMVNAHLALAAKIATQIVSKRTDTKFERGDILSEAVIAMHNAAEKYNASKGARFSTFAAWHIKSAIQVYFQKNTSIVKTRNTSLINRFAHAMAPQIVRRLRFDDPAISPDQIMERLTEEWAKTSGKAISPALKQKLQEALDKERSSQVAIDAPIRNGQTTTFAAFLPSTDPSAEDIYIKRELETLCHDFRAAAYQYLEENPPFPSRTAERNIDITLKRFFAPKENTLGALGTAHGISSERVRQISQKGINAIESFAKEYMAERGYDLT